VVDLRGHSISQPRLAIGLVAVRAADLGNAVAGETPGRIVHRDGRIVLRDGGIVARTRTAAELARPELRAAMSAWNLPGAYCAGKTYRERIVPLTGAGPAAPPWWNPLRQNAWRW
jgi:hypothetical protein